MSSCLVIAGEKSGEEHASSFLPAVIENLSEINFFGVGGEYFSQLGVDLLYDFKEFSSGGYSEVIGKIPFYLNALKVIENECIKRNCKYAILIDFQEFNLKLAKRLSKRGVKIYYYVAPQAWAWKEWRVKTVRNYVHTLFTILPFEQKWFEQFGVRNVCSVPHPVFLKYKDIDVLANKSKISKIRIGLFPGSRRSEIKYLMPLFVKSVQKLQLCYDLELFLLYPEHLGIEIIMPYVKNLQIKLIPNSKMDDMFKSIDLALASSGTINLSLACFHIPTVVCYKSSLMNEFIYNTFVNYTGKFSLPNIILGETIFPELIQDEATVYNISKHLSRWISSPSERSKLSKSFVKLRAILESSSFNVSNYLIGQMS